MYKKVCFFHSQRPCLSVEFDAVNVSMHINCINGDPKQREAS